MRIVPDKLRKVNIGDRHEKYEIIGVPFYAAGETSLRRRQWAVAECDCGQVFVFNVQSHCQRTSCGCEVAVVAGNRMRTHGEFRTRIYSTWQNMRQRCSNPRRDNYPRYGGKGVRVCKEWNESFVAFRDWAFANGYAEHLTIDRINARGNYEPGNCRWVTKSENSRAAMRAKHGTKP